MKRILFLLVTITTLIACEQQRTRPDDAQGTAFEFIRSALDGDYKWARELMYKNSDNNAILDILEKKYKTEMSATDKEGYKKASIRIFPIENVSDSVVIIPYANSYKKITRPLKVVKKDGKWQVDLNYTFTGNL